MFEAISNNPYRNLRAPRVDLRRLRPALPALIFLFVFMVVPLSSLLLLSVTKTETGLGNYISLLGNATYGRVLLNTFTIAAIVTLVSLVIAYPVAWLLAIL